MAANQPTSPTPNRPSQILDPYPERPTRLGGVRKTTHLAVVPDPVELQAMPTVAPTSFAASFQRLPTRRRRQRAPVASTLLAVFGQGFLGALMATQTVDAVMGLVISVGWLVCGLVLIAAQCMSLARSES